MQFSSPQFIPMFIALLHSVGVVSALGINCRGSSNCFDGISSNLLQDLTNTVSSHINTGRFYGNGQQIICEIQTGVCAFTQNSGGISGGSVTGFLNELLQHGCTVCGSVPLNPGNNVANGELTVNSVSNHCGGTSFPTDGFDFVLCN